MIYLACILVGAVIARIWWTPIAGVLRVLAWLLALWIGVALARWVGVSADWINSAGAGALFGLIIVGIGCYYLGWWHRVERSEQEAIERAHQQAARDRKVV
jgi:hypothetical protein